MITTDMDRVTEGGVERFLSEYGLLLDALGAAFHRIESERDTEAWHLLCDAIEFLANRSRDRLLGMHPDLLN